MPRRTFRHPSDFQSQFFFQAFSNHGPSLGRHSTRLRALGHNIIERRLEGKSFEKAPKQFVPYVYSRREPGPAGVPGAFAGNAGEFFVLAELTRRGWTAALTARNNRAYDILAKRGDEFAGIRVKTKTSAFTLFQWNAKPSGEIFLEISERIDFCALVDIPEEGSDASPTYGAEWFEC
jgi:hypothetical protein